MTGLEELPARMDRLESQIVELREENRVEHSAIRTEIQSVHEEMRAMHAALRAEMQSLISQLKEQDDRQDRLTRVLHEDLIARIAALGEALPKRTDEKT